MTAPVRWGIVGAGRMAGAFAEDLQRLPDVDIIAVTSRTKANARAFADRFDVPHIHGSADDVAADPDVDMIYVATPHHRHRADMLASIRHGKHVVCEKPFTVTAAEAAEVVAAARARGVFCMEGMWTRFLPAVRELREMVEGGVIGDVRLVEAEFCLADAFDPASRLFDLAQAGGSLLDRGVYPLSIALMLLGVPDEVRAMAHLGDSGVDETAVVQLSYGDGALATVSSSLRTTGVNHGVVMGTGGTIVVGPPLWRPTRLVLELRQEEQAGDAATASASHARVRSVASAAARAARRYPVSRRAGRAIRSGVRRVRGTGPRTIRSAVTGLGYGYEAVEAMRCVRAGLTESPILPLDETVALLDVMDRARRQIGLTYAADVEAGR
jgi:predicted dehydrogenase